METAEITLNSATLGARAADLRPEAERRYLMDIAWRRAMLETESVDAGDLCRFFNTTSYCIREGVYRGKFPAPTLSIYGKDFWITADIRAWVENRKKMKGLV